MEKTSKTASSNMRGNTINSEVSKYFDFFLTKWIVTGRIDDLIKENVDISEVKYMLMNDKIESSKMNDKTWVRTLFAMWLIRDHGLVNYLGHGMPYKEGFNELIYTGYKMSYPFENLSDAIHFPGTSQPYLVIAIPPFDSVEQRCVAFFQFRHTHRDTVALLAIKEAGSWKVTGLSWIIH